MGRIDREDSERGRGVKTLDIVLCCRSLAIKLVAINLHVAFFSTFYCDLLFHPALCTQV